MSCMKNIKSKVLFYSADTVVEEQPWGDREFPALDHDRNLLTFYEEIRKAQGHH